MNAQANGKCQSKDLLRIVLLTVLISGPSPANSYPWYDNAGQGCIQCHSLNGGDALQFNESQHEGFVSDHCQYCHTNCNGGGVLFTYTSCAGQGCRGCHGVNNGTNYTWGTGLRLHHTRAGVPADANGMRCADCHANDPPPMPQSTLPVYYTNSDVTIKNPCLDHLDNAGNLMTDEVDPDCAFCIKSITQVGDDIHLSWQSVVGRTNFLQVSTGQTGGNYSTNFTDLTSMIITGTVRVTTNWVDVGGVTNSALRYYRIRHQ